MAARLGDILVSQGSLTGAQLDQVLHSQSSEKGMLGTILLRRGMVNISQLGAALEQQFNVAFRQINPAAINPQVVRLIPESLARDRQSVPIGVENGSLILAMVAPDDIDAICETELITGYSVEPVVSLQSDVLATIDQGYDEKIVARQTIVDMKMADLRNTSENASQSPAAAREIDDDAPVVRLVRSILMGAIDASVSDIHLEPHVPQMRVRYRVDGELQQVMTIPNHIEEAVVARIKVMAEMDTTETRKPQDGHLAINEQGAKASLRVSTIPTVGGEKVVMRVLDDGNKSFKFDSLGMSAAHCAMIQRLIAKPHGMIVITGPTGSGKSTTMYAMLSALNSIDTNIVTVEDPVEYRLTGINQVSADSQHGLGFANALKYILRQDPDVIMVGEIRDHETAQTAVQAALTGHLLISTLHTNDAVGAVARLNDLGVDPFKIGGGLLGSIAQRLLRAICPECKEPCQPNQKMLRTLLKGADPPANVTFYHGRGCKKCIGSGYAGRLPIFEILEVTPSLAEAIERGAPHTVLQRLATEQGMATLEQAGLERAYAGVTTVEEVFFKVSS